MLISKKWLTKFIPDIADIDSEEIARELKMKTVEVESIMDQASALHDIVVGEVVSVRKHDNADSLNICMVDVGEGEHLQVVCGGTNVLAGMRVAMGKIGAEVLWHGEGEPVTLIKAKIRGEYSYGMICASDEIGLSATFPKSSEKEIVDLSHLECPLGTPLATALELDDTIFDIENKSLSNRPDLFGHYGIARELSTIFDIPLIDYSSSGLPKGKSVVSVEIEDDKLCPRYSAIRVDGVRVTASPMWLQNILSVVGVRPINIFVDITNFVMMELGQPMHVFDADTLEGSITVRRAKEGEKILTLDDEERILTEDTLVIADDVGAIAIAGVIGGYDSRVTDDTKSIIFESANFDAVSVRRASTSLGVRTESSTRFEKAQDPSNTISGLARAIELLREVDSTVIVSPVTDIDHSDSSILSIELDVDYVSDKIGVRVPEDEIARILTGLGFILKVKNGIFTVKVPSWRKTKDVSIREDLVEEILRMYGYNMVPSGLPEFVIFPPRENTPLNFERKVKDALAHEFGYTELYSYSFESEEWLHRLGLDTDKHLRLSNPVAKDRPLVRRHLLPNMLLSLEKNLHRFDTVKTFETGLVYRNDMPGQQFSPTSEAVLPEQKRMLGMTYADKSIGVPFREITFALTNTFSKFGLELKFRKSEAHTLYHPGRCAEVLAGDVVVGRVGELHPVIGARIGIDFPVGLSELDLSIMVDLIHHVSDYRELSEYPSVTRDIAIVVDREIEVKAVYQLLTGYDPLIESVRLFDVYTGVGVSSGSKSLAFSIVYRSSDHTLESGEVDTVHGRVIDIIKKEFKAEIR